MKLLDTNGENMNEVTRVEPAPVPAEVKAPATPADMILYVMQQGGSIDQLEKFYALQQRYEADQARKAFVEDMAAFKRNPPEIIKDKAVGFTNRDGTFTGYKHATLGNVTSAIVEGLAKHGFSHRWDVRQNGPIAEVDCVITHRQGHSEKVTMQAAKDDSGNKNAIQQVASAISYLQRYTLLLATGLATHDQDDDGHGAELDTSLADKWMDEVNKSATKEALEATWQSALKEIRAVDDKHAYNEVKSAVVARKAVLEGGAK